MTSVIDPSSVTVSLVADGATLSPGSAAPATTSITRHALGRDGSQYELTTYPLQKNKDPSLPDRRGARGRELLQEWFKKEAKDPNVKVFLKLHVNKTTTISGNVNTNFDFAYSLDVTSLLASTDATMDEKSMKKAFDGFLANSRTEKNITMVKMMDRDYEFAGAVKDKLNEMLLERDRKAEAIGHPSYEINSTLVVHPQSYTVKPGAGSRPCVECCWTIKDSTFCCCETTACVLECFLCCCECCGACCTACCASEEGETCIYPGCCAVRMAEYCMWSGEFSFTSGLKFTAAEPAAFVDAIASHLTMS